MLQKCSRTLSKLIILGAASDGYNPEVIEYGLVIILGTLLKFASIVIISFILNTFAETMISLAVYVLIRHFAGGTHLKTYGMCFVTGVLMFSINGLVAKHAAIPLNVLILITDMVLMMGLFIALYWVPAGTEKKVVRDIDTRRCLKGVTMILLGIYGIIANALFFAGQRAYLAALFLGVSEALLFATPAGYRLLNARFVGSQNQFGEEDSFGEHTDMRR